MRSLSEVPWGQLSVGDRVKSVRGEPGVIIKLEDKQILPKATNPDFYFVSMQWDYSQKVSRARLSILSGVTYLGQSQ